MNFKKKRTFLEKLTGRGYDEDDQYEYESEELEEVSEVQTKERSTPKGMIKNKGMFDPDSRSTWMDEQVDEGELSIDMYQTPDTIVLRTMIPGVKKEDLDISLSRDSIIIKGKRAEESKAPDQDYFHRELYWGAFSRKVDLPHEVDIEQADAVERNGMLTLTLPRTDKGRQTKLKIKSI